jgi:hypothetical protein
MSLPAGNEGSSQNLHALTQRDGARLSLGLSSGWLVVA